MKSYAIQGWLAVLMAVAGAVSGMATEPDAADSKGVLSKDKQSFSRKDSAPPACTATFVVAAADSPDHLKAQADFICDGLDDHIVVNAAIEALPATGGRVHLTAGTFSIGGVEETHGGISIFRGNVLLTGEGSGTRLILQDGLADINVIWICGDDISNVTVRDLYINGNGKNLTRTRGLGWKGCNGVKARGKTQKRGNHPTFPPRNIRVENCHIENCRLMAVMLTGDVVEVLNCYFTGDFGSHVIELLDRNGRIEGCTLRLRDGEQAVFGFSTDACKNYHIINNKVIIDAGGIMKAHPINNWPRASHGIIAGNMVINNGKSGPVLIRGDMDMVHNNIFCKVPVKITALGVIFEHNMLINSALEINANSDKRSVLDNNRPILISGNWFSDTKVTHTAGNVIWGANPGYVTENSGVAAIAGDQTAVIVEHGLSVAPAAVHVTPANSMGAAAKFWVEAMNEQHFTIRVDAVPGTTAADFYWQAAISGGQVRDETP